MVQHPEVLWAQRSSPSDSSKNIVYLTVNLPDIQPLTLEYNLTSTSISFKATAGDPARNIPEREYKFDLDFFAEVAPEESTSKLTTRSFNVVLRKKEVKEEYWPRLTKEKVRNAFLKTDFNRWVDEDEQEGAVDPVADEDEGFDGRGGIPGMSGMGGMPGMGGGMPGGMDIEQLMAQMGGAGGFNPGASSGSATNDDEENDSDDDGPPPLEDAEPSK